MEGEIESLVVWPLRLYLTDFGFWLLVAGYWLLAGLNLLVDQSQGKPLDN